MIDSAQTPISAPASARDIASLRQVLTTIDADSCPRSYNFHMHTVCSDGLLQPEALIEQAINIGLKGLAISDHHTADGYWRAQRRLEEIAQDTPASALPHLWTGLEINADLGGAEVHILCYAFDPEHPSMETYLLGLPPWDEAALAAQVIKAVRQAGGLTVLAHPARYRRSAKELITLAAELGIDGVEAYYAYNNPKPWQPSPKVTEEVKQIGGDLGLLLSCGTDTHGLNLLQRL